MVSMNTTRIEHIGIAVKNLEDAIKMYENIFGVPCYKIEDIPDQKVRTGFLLVGQTKIELLESTDVNGSIGRFIEKKGEGVHHIALSVENLEESLQEAEKNGLQLIDKHPRQGAEGLKIAFLHPKSTGGVLIEFCEDAPLRKQP
jgi:methylmalonyl-CoA/ethylmalonyl-CoA epimerase